ncbi:helix-turn-helix transcriptional regulator [Fontibacillus sp. BL9]|uniref:helix-turn-helix transcriptional regulator n=1 Tax=Fontibacillus sp. BL9 TaxID=3389971 RepID=UPI00397B36C6
MKRMDRMMAIVMALQQRAETAQSLADKLEVSKRTVLRDMQALSEMGVPLYAVPGPGGGYRLMEGYKLPPLQLTSDEALTLLMSLDGMTKYSDGPFRQARWTVTDKIRSALPEQTLGEISPWLKHIGLEVPDHRTRTPHLNALMKYAADGSWLHVLYRSQNYRRYLDVRPARIYAAHGFWYCKAYSHQHEETRTFRVDRIEELEELAPEEAAGFEAMAAARPKPEEDDNGSPEQTIRIRSKLTYRGALQAEQDPDIGQLVRQTGDEEWEVDFNCPPSEWNWAISFFFRLGLDAEVLEPRSLRDSLRQRAADLMERYDT